MSSQVKFRVETVDGSQLGKLGVPYPQVAEWISFLVAPRRNAQIVSAKQWVNGVIIYFQANEELYAYLEGHINSQVGAIHPENVYIGKALAAKWKNDLRQ